MIRRLIRKMIALSAAYALALTVLLPFLALATMPADAGGSMLAAICRGQQPGSSNESGSPVGHGPVCPCGAACSMAACSAGAPATRAARVFDRTSDAGLTPFPPSHAETATAPERRRPQAARAPPA
jgi:hypothetical protein